MEETLALRLAREDCDAILFFCLLTKYFWSFAMGFGFFTPPEVLCRLCLWEVVGSESVGVDAYEWSCLTVTSCWESIGEGCSSSGLFRPRASSEKSKVTSLSLEEEKGDAQLEKFTKSSVFATGGGVTLKSGEDGKESRRFVPCRSSFTSINSMRKGSSKPLGSVHSTGVDRWDGGLLWHGEGEGTGTPSSPVLESNSDMNIWSRRWVLPESNMSGSGEESTSGGLGSLKSPGVGNQGGNAQLSEV